MALDRRPAAPAEPATEALDSVGGPPVMLLHFMDRLPIQQAHELREALVTGHSVDAVEQSEDAD